MITVPMTASTDVVVFPARLSVSSLEISSELGVRYEVSDKPYYRDDYEVTPSDEMQILHVANMAMIHDIVINPIPSNYGKVTYNGQIITIT